MKNLILLMLALSSHVYANNFNNAPNTERSYLVTLPEITEGIVFRANSHQDGICIAMGYTRAAIGSALLKEYEGPMVAVNDKGVITGGVINKGEGFLAVESLICLGEENTEKEEVVLTHLLAEELKHPYSEVVYSSGSNVHGVCKSLGYALAVPGAVSVKAASERQQMVVLDSNGRVTSGFVVTNRSNANMISELVCINY